MSTTGLIPDGAKALLFDIDGTILDSNDQRSHSWRQAAGKHGLDLSKTDYLAYTGMKGSDIVDKLCSDQGVDLTPEQRQDVVATESEIFKDTGLEEAEPVAIVMRIIKEGRARGIPMGVVSGGEHAVVEKALGVCGIGDAFKVVVSAKDVEHAKPAPDIYQLAAKRLGVDPRGCVAYEDAPLGVESARRAGYLEVVDVTSLDQHPERGMKDGGRGEGAGEGLRGEVEDKARGVM